VETKLLVGERGNYRLAKPIESTQVPATVQAVLAARLIDLRMRNVFFNRRPLWQGRSICAAQAIADQSDEEVRRGLIQLQAAEFFTRRVSFRTSNTPLSTPLHEVAYGTLFARSPARAYAHRRNNGSSSTGTDSSASGAWLTMRSGRGLGQRRLYLREAGTKALSRSAEQRR
jgi:hypothetical protein